MNQAPLTTTIILLAMLASTTAEAASFRCGTRIVIIGDSIGRLVRACGKPALKYKARETIREDGRRQTTGVTHWVYERGRRKNMVVSVRSGKVVRIQLE
ncbi:MAG: DUF2845 domain-containing protein [Xanthomonadales bacterium]|nr:DUF2845 domain-containing protein [Xanthomonadales bacterium]